MNNPVSKHAHKYNKALVHKDKKKATKQGYRKHKKDSYTRKNRLTQLFFLV